MLFEFTGCHHLAAGLETIDEIRPATTVAFAASGPRENEMARRFAADIADLARAHGGGNRRLAIERVSSAAAAALAREGFTLSDAQAPVERARAIKSPAEIASIRQSLVMVERAVGAVADQLRPGMSENEAWAILHKSVIERMATTSRPAGRRCSRDFRTTIPCSAARSEAPRPLRPALRLDLGSARKKTGVVGVEPAGAGRRRAPR